MYLIGRIFDEGSFKSNMFEDSVCKKMFDGKSI